MNKMSGLGTGGARLSSLTSDGGPEVDANCNEIEGYLSEGFDSDACGSKMEKSNNNQAGGDDVAPVYVLQPKEIIKNIDLMKTVAILMENKLQSWTVIKRLDEEKMKDLCGDIERFPEAFHKFISIIHQIQYLNVTSDWNFANSLDSIPISSSSNGGGVISRLFGSDKPPVHPALVEYDARKQVMLYLHSTLQQVFTRYLKIQNILEDRLKKCKDLLIAEDQGKQMNKCSNASDSDEDDPLLPLLVTSKRRSRSASARKVWLEKVETLRGILRRTKRSAAEVQDSVEVLRDLILWDYKQVVSIVTAPCRGNSDGSVGTSHNGNDSSYSVDIEGGGMHCSRHSQISHEFLPATNNGQGRKRMWTVFVLLTVLTVVLVTVAALSFLRFHY